MSIHGLCGPVTHIVTSSWQRNLDSFRSQLFGAWVGFVVQVRPRREDQMPPGDLRQNSFGTETCEEMEHWSSAARCKPLTSPRSTATQKQISNSSTLLAFVCEITRCFVSLWAQSEVSQNKKLLRSGSGERHRVQKRADQYITENFLF